MTQQVLVAVLMGAVSLLYATAGQAGGTAFLAVMALTSFPASEMRPTALFPERVCRRLWHLQFVQRCKN